jgi:hypothetical protein
MRNWVGGWIDWNLALDLRGGPNWASWKADAAILVSPKSDEFFKQPIHYGIGHVSKFVPPGSVRIDMLGAHVPRNLQSVAFLRPDNGTVIVFLNKSVHFCLTFSSFPPKPFSASPRTSHPKYSCLDLKLTLGVELTQISKPSEHDTEPNLAKTYITRLL